MKVANDDIRKAIETLEQTEEQTPEVKFLKKINDSYASENSMLYNRLETWIAMWELRRRNDRSTTGIKTRQVSETQKGVQRTDDRTTPSETA